jgi:hypothetical protein
MTYSVEPLGLRHVQCNLLSSVSETGRDRPGKRPRLFGESYGSKASEFQEAHKAFHQFCLGLVRRCVILTLHEVDDSEEDSDQPRLRLLWVFLSGREEWFCVVFQFLVTVRTRIRVKKTPKFSSTMRTFRSVHFDLLAKGLVAPFTCTWLFPPKWLEACCIFIDWY